MGKMSRRIWTVTGDYGENVTCHCFWTVTGDYGENVQTAP